jgi:hypothetical protein
VARTFAVVPRFPGNDGNRAFNAPLPAARDRPFLAGLFK